MVLTQYIKIRGLYLLINEEFFSYLVIVGPSLSGENGSYDFTTVSISVGQ